MTLVRRFQDVIAVVTGGGRGIGRATALGLGREGAHVVVADSAAESGNDVAEEIRSGGGSAEAHSLDAADASAVRRFFKGVGSGHGRIDVLVNCPARASDTHFERITESEFDLDVAVTLKAPFLCIQAALPYLLRCEGGASVVSISSVNGLEAFGNEIYGAAKAGVINLTKNLAIRYGSFGVRFNVVAPGTVRTRLWDARIAADPGVFDTVAARYPLRRVGVPEDVAAACLFLASRDAGWITGTTLAVDGGITAGHPEFIETIFGESFFTSDQTDRRPHAGQGA